MKKSELAAGDKVVLVSERRTSRYIGNVHKNPYDAVGSGRYVTGLYWEVEVVDPAVEWTTPRYSRYGREQIGVYDHKGVKVRITALRNAPKGANGWQVGDEVNVEAKLLICPVDEQKANFEIAEEGAKRAAKGRRVRESEIRDLSDRLNGFGLHTAVTTERYGSSEIIRLDREDAEKILALLDNE